MTRDLTSQVEAALADPVIRPIRLFYADFTTAWRTWTGYGILEWGGYEWIGTGDALQISASQETIDTGSEPLEVILSGVEPDKVSLALQEPYKGKDVEIWYGFLDSAWGVIPDPFLEYAGVADLLSHTDDGASALLQLSIDTAWSDTGPSNFRYSDASQRALFPDDAFFEFAARHSMEPTEWKIK